MPSIEGIITDNDEILSPSHIWLTYQMYRDGQKNYHSFMDTTAGFYLLNIAEFLYNEPATRPPCSYATLISIFEKADFRKVLVMLSSEPVEADKAVLRMHLSVSPSSAQAEQICNWHGLKSFIERLVGSSPLPELTREAAAIRNQSRQGVLDFVERYQFLK